MKHGSAVPGHHEFIRSESLHPLGSAILIHGLGLDLRSWDYLAERLKKEFHVVRYDLLGHGNTGSARQTVTLELLVAQAKQIIQLYCNDKVIIFAHGIGGSVGALYSNLYPDQVECLILCSSPGFIPLEAKKHLANQRHLMANSSGLRSLAETMCKKITSLTDEHSKHIVMGGFLRVVPSVYFGLIDMYLEYEPVDDFKKLSVPTLMLSGENDGIYPTYLHAITSANIQNCTYNIVPHSSNMVFFDQPEYTYRKAMEFVDAIRNKPIEREAEYDILHKSIKNLLDKNIAFLNEEPTLTAHLINSLEIEVHGRKITDGLNKRYAKQMLIYLIFHRTVSREDFIDLFWPALDIESARNNLRVCLTHLKKIIDKNNGTHFLSIDRECVSLVGKVYCDALELIREVKTNIAEKEPDRKIAMASQLLSKLTSYRKLYPISDDWYVTLQNNVETQIYELFMWAADFEIQRNHDQNAKKYLKKNVELFPAETEAYIALFHLFEKSGDKEEQERYQRMYRSIL